MKRITVGVIHKTYAGWPLGPFSAQVCPEHHACRLHEAERSLTHENLEYSGVE